MSTAEAVLNEVLEAFDFGSPVVGIARYGCGHINDTFCVHTHPRDDCCDCFILQRMSDAAFKYPDQLMTLVCGIRFLTDYLVGDSYFRTHREGQNLDRCRTQFKLVSSMEEHWDEMCAIVNQFRKG